MEGAPDLSARQLCAFCARLWIKYLIDNIPYKLKPGASYINERKSVTFHPSGSNIYSCTGTKLIKIQLTGDSFMDPSIFRLMFDLVNTESTVAKELRVLGSPGSFFRRARLLCGGICIEDIDDYARVEAMFHLMNNKNLKIITRVKVLINGISWLIGNLFIQQTLLKELLAEEVKRFYLNRV